MTVWVDSWQMQCCGTPFRVGSQVTWILAAADLQWIDTMLGATAQQVADAAEDHHGGVPGDTLPTRGTVTHITAVHCLYAPRSGSGSQTVHPVPGSGVRTDVEMADGRIADRGDERFVGYLVRLEL